MLIRNRLPLSFLLITYFIGLSITCIAQTANIYNDIQEKRITFSNNKIKMILDYNGKVNISQVILNGQEIIAGDAGIYSSIKTKNANYSTLQLLSQPSAKVIDNTIVVSGIKYGDNTLSINETWTFIITS